MKKAGTPNIVAEMIHTTGNKDKIPPYTCKKNFISIDETHHGFHTMHGSFKALSVARENSQKKIILCMVDSNFTLLLSA
jgi:hypothetical protein